MLRSGSFDPVRTIPYLIAIAAFFYGRYVMKARDSDYQEFITNSPGIEVSTKGITYGPGHGFKKKAD
jgi:hypothetical protein